MTDEQTSVEHTGSSPVGRGGAGVYIEGELGAFYLLQMLAGGEAHGLPGAIIERVQFQGEKAGFELDDLIIHGRVSGEATLLEIQSKRTITFSPKDDKFIEVCKQIVRTADLDEVSKERHLLAVATQRTSFAISGPYQDVLAQARAASSGAAFFKQLERKGAASPKMREFAAAFRTHLVAAGIKDDDEAVWSIVRRFQILEFDFESSAPMARAHALSVARGVLATDMTAQAGALWSTLIELSLDAARTGLTIDRATAVEKLVAKGFRFAGKPDFSAARAVLAEMSDFAIEDIGTEVAGVRLPRLRVLAEIEEARDRSRFVEIRGAPGVGKSAVFRDIAERARRSSPTMVLDPARTPGGGWTALAQRLGAVATAQDFLADLASSGAGVIFVDSLEMFTSAEKRRTVSDVLRAAGRIPGFSVVATSRLSDGPEEEGWLSPDVAAAFGERVQIEVGELDDDEVEYLCEADASLKLLLASDQPSEKVARNLYRLSRLLKIPDTTGIRTEAALARVWWDGADGADSIDVRAAQRILSNLADAALETRIEIEVREDSTARSHLLGALTLRETARDRLSFYHDVLRDWAIGIRLTENPKLIANLDLARPVPAVIARGIEIAGRFALEQGDDEQAWLQLLTALSPVGAHGSWRRQALMAIVRSEQAPLLLKKNTEVLLRDRGALFEELVNVMAAVDTITVADFYARAGPLPAGASIEAMRSMRTAAAPSIYLVLDWCADQASEIHIGLIPSVTKLSNLLLPFSIQLPAMARRTAGMLFDWLMQIDVEGAENTIPTEPDEAGRGKRKSGWIGDLRSASLLLARSAPDKARSYLAAIVEERDASKVRAVRPMSQLLCSIAPDEIADLIGKSLIPKTKPPGRTRGYHDGLRSPFGGADYDYMPESPAQPPFLDLLTVNKNAGLRLARSLTDYCATYRSNGHTPDGDGFTLELKSGERFFPWSATLFWSRDEAVENCVACALMALEAWGHERMEAGEDIDTVIGDVLGPDGGCAGYIMVAVDLLLSHWPKTRDALVPFVTCPELLIADRERQVREQLRDIDFSGRSEPTGRVQRKDLNARPSRGNALEQLLPAYMTGDEASIGVRARLERAVERLGPYTEEADTRDPAFVAARSLNIINRQNWGPVEGGLAYQAPEKEAAVIARANARADVIGRVGGIQARIQLAVGEKERGSPELAREAAEYVATLAVGDEDEETEDMSAGRIASVAMLVARDGDEELLAAREAWLRGVIRSELERSADRFRSMSATLSFNRTALAAKALIHLWCRERSLGDREAILRLAMRRDSAGPLAASAAIGELIAADPRMVKSLMRIGFAASRWRWHPMDEEDEETETYEREDTQRLLKAVAAEIDWLDGGDQPAWPPFPTARPFVRRPSRISVPGAQAFEEPTVVAEDPKAPVVRADSHTAAGWLKLAVDGLDWIQEIVEAYWDWSASENGVGLSADAEIDRTPDEWNFAFYPLVAPTLMALDVDRFDRMTDQFEGLPDRSFCHLVRIVMRAVDAWYFNDSSHAADRPAEIRRRFGARAMATRGWSYHRRPGELSIDMDTAEALAPLFLNDRSLSGPPSTYLPQKLFSRIDPMLGALRPLLGGGPVHYVARCTMNTMLVDPLARHADFMLEAVEAWLEKVPADLAVWIDAGLGANVVGWFQRASEGDPALLSSEHPLRTRMDDVLGRLVALGVGEAHELERRIADAVRP